MLDCNHFHPPCFLQPCHLPTNDLRSSCIYVCIYIYIFDENRGKEKQALIIDRVHPNNLSDKDRFSQHNLRKNEDYIDLIS